jgi:hypothetical protein
LRSYGYLPCRTNKESEQMKPPNRNTTETFLGAMYEREDLLRQEAQNSRMGRVAYRMARWVRMIARVAFVLLVVGILAAITVGVITGVIIASLALLVWAVKRLPNPPYRNWWQ